MEESKTSNSFDVKSKFKHWVFTLQNPSEEQISALLSNDVFEYIVIGREIAPSTGQLHGQGFCSFKNQRYFKSVQKILGHCFCEPKAKFSTTDQAIEYCKKDGNWSEAGSPTLTSKQMEGILYTLATMSELLNDIPLDIFDEYSQLDEMDNYIHELACDTETILYDIDPDNPVFEIAEMCNRCEANIECQHSIDLDDMNIDPPTPVSHRYK